MSPAPQKISFNGTAPEVDPAAWVAPTATLIGAVRIGARTGVYYGAVVRGDSAAIVIGDGSNLQDNVVVHADPGFPATIGAGVSVGHAAVLHGCTVEDDCLIGMGAVVLNGAVIGRGSMIAAGAVVLEGAVIPAGSLVAGVPGKVRRELTAEERDGILRNASGYVDRSAAHRDALAASGYQPASSEAGSV
jgi:carbonic anhydrase/acetyltransferase-like protein (isoleucine patch superfamily)